MKRSAAKSAKTPVINFVYNMGVAEEIDDPGIPEPLPGPSTSTHQAPTQDKVSKAKRARITKKLTEQEKEKLPLNCCWYACSFSNNNLRAFVTHVVNHVGQLELVQVGEDKKRVYQCLWGTCDYLMSTVTEAQIHVSFHGFYKHLSSYGAAILAQDGHPQCTRDQTYRDMIPEEISSSKKLVCLWDSCNEEFLNPYWFYAHVKGHASYAASEKEYKCKWQYCNRKTRKSSDLILHMQMHTLEKAIACPNCGYSYANLSKFYDHCMRQVEAKTHECATCKKMFASERLLRDHMNLHEQTYQCPFCDTKWASPSALSIHVTCRHLPGKQYQCSICSFKGKLKKNLVDHMNVHFSHSVYDCSVEECEFTCRSKLTIRKHEFEKHNIGRLAQYACHLCERLFGEGRVLKRHLISHHNFPLPEEKTSYYLADDGLRYLAGYSRSAVEQTPPDNDSLFIAYDHIDEEGNVTSKILIGAQPINKLAQVITLPNAEEDGSEPDLQNLKAVPITTGNPPMFVMQSTIDSFKAANKDMGAFSIITQLPTKEEPQK